MLLWVSLLDLLILRLIQLKYDRDLLHYHLEHIFLLKLLNTFYYRKVHLKQLQIPCYVQLNIVSFVEILKHSLFLVSSLIQCENDVQQLTVQQYYFKIKSYKNINEILQNLSNLFSLQITYTLYYASDNNDFKYLTKFTAPDKLIAVVKYENDKYSTKLYVNELEFERAKKQVQCEVLLNKNLRTKPLVEQFDIILKENKINKFQITDDFPCSVYQQLKDLGYQITCIKDYIPQRRHKTNYEINEIKQSNYINCLCFDRIKQILSESQIDENNYLIFQGEKLTSEKLKYEVYLINLKYQANPKETIIAHGEQSARPHDEGSGAIKANEFIVCDIFPSNQNGYFGDMTRTFLKGKPTEQQIKQYNAVKQVHDDCINAAKVGICYQDLSKLCLKRFEELGFPKKDINGTPSGMIHGLGHGVGLDVHEEPSFYNKQNKCEIGDIFTIEPGLYYKEQGGVRVEDSLYVKENGEICKLAEYSYDWIIE